MKTVYGNNDAQIYVQIAKRLELSGNEHLFMCYKLPKVLIDAIVANKTNLTRYCGYLPYNWWPELDLSPHRVVRTLNYIRK